MNPCGFPHFPTQPCPKRMCDLLDASGKVLEQGSVSRKAALSKPRIDVIREETIEPPIVHMSVQHDPDQFGEVRAPKPNRKVGPEQVETLQVLADAMPEKFIAEAEEQLERIEVAREALTNAQRQKKHREKDLEGYRARNASRMRRKRKS